MIRTPHPKVVGRRKAPPRRDVDHSIVLILGEQPINLRPYRYSFIQKDVIEKMVRVMLEAELI